MEAARDFDCKTIAMAGGVAANSALPRGPSPCLRSRRLSLTYPELGLCTDNAAA